MAFIKLPAVECSVACLTCGSGARSDIDMEWTIAVGIGLAGYSVDGKTIWEEGMSDGDFDSMPKVQDVERLALAEPDRDWRIFFFAPMYEAEYQRQGEGVWVLIRKGRGFA